MTEPAVNLEAPQDGPPAFAGVTPLVWRRQRQMSAGPSTCPTNAWCAFAGVPMTVAAVAPCRFNTLDVIPAKAGTHPEMAEPAVDVETPQDGPRPSPG